jgi:hypothetical protein
MQCVNPERKYQRHKTMIVFFILHFCQIIKNINITVLHPSQHFKETVVLSLPSFHQHLIYYYSNSQFSLNFTLNVNYEI